MSDTLSKNLEGNRFWPYPGSRWWKFDFHTHTPASNDYGKGRDQASLRDISPRDWLLDFMRAGVDCVAVTDHNTGGWIDPLKQAIAELRTERPPDFRELHLFPGVEITANGNVHILAILGMDKGTADVDTLLGSIGRRSDPGSSELASDSSPIEVIQAIHQQGYIPILAHVDDERTGAWKLGGSTLKPILELSSLIAIEVVDIENNKPELYLQRGLSLAEVLGSDSHHPEGQNRDRYPGSHYTWIKVANPPSLEGVRLALVDGQRFSIRRSDDTGNFDPYKLPDFFVKEIEISEARYMGRGEPAKVQFNPWLNAIIGGRGTGKSTIIHSMRLVSRRENELNNLADREPSLAFNRFNRSPKDSKDEGGLSESTQITWSITRAGVDYRVRWSSLGNDITVKENLSGHWKPSDIQAVTPERFPIRIFSQGQIAELAGDNPEALLHIIDEAAGTTTYLKDLRAARLEFEETQARIRNLKERLNSKDGLMIELQDTKNKLDKFEKARHAKVLKNYQNRSRQKRELDRQFSATRDIAARIEDIVKSLHLEDLPEDLFDMGLKEDKEILSIIGSLSKAVSTAAHELQTSADSLYKKVEQLLSSLASSAWQQAVNYATDGHTELVEQLKSEGISDPSEYGTLVQDRQRIDNEIKNLDSLYEEYENAKKRSQSQLDRMQQIRKMITTTRENFLDNVLVQNRFVRILTIPYGHEPHAIERSLRNALNVPDDRFSIDILTDNGNGKKGIVMDLLKGLNKVPKQRSARFEYNINVFKGRIREACLGNGDFHKPFNNYLKREYDNHPAFLNNILTWFPEDGLRVEYSPKGDGKNFKPILQASAGQRSAAMLAFLLSYGDEPLILDQPEDDLDNSLIYDLVVRQIRENKLNRQIIVVTHNPNVVVNGDSEMLHALDFVDDQCLIVKSGSLQKDDIRQEICQIMEGGREAFERRYQRLGNL